MPTTHSSPSPGITQPDIARTWIMVALASALLACDTKDGDAEDEGVREGQSSAAFDDASVGEGEGGLAAPPTPPLEPDVIVTPGSATTGRLGADGGAGSGRDAGPGGDGGAGTNGDAGTGGGDAATPDAALQDATTSEGTPRCGDGVVNGTELCDPGVDLCCRETCDGVQESGFECRPSAGVCDQPEYCDGADAACPDDRFQSAETSCNQGSGECSSSGHCPGNGPDCASPQDPEGTRCNSGLGTCRSGLCCPGTTVREGPGCGLADVDGNGLADEGLVFVTSLDYWGNLGGPGEANALCSAAANNARIEGTFSAWVSSDGNNPVAAFTRIGNRAYYRVDGIPVASSLIDVIDGALTNSIAIAETGETRATDVWTGSSTNGTAPVGAASLTCSGWTTIDPAVLGQAGRSDAADATWTAKGPLDCSMHHALYCFEDTCPGQPTVNLLTDAKNCGACGNACAAGEGCAKGACGSALLVFVTSATYTGDLVKAATDAGGAVADVVEAADYLCNQQAAQGKLAGSYVAWISTSTLDAGDRLKDGAYYLPPDPGAPASSLGPLVASSLAQLLGTGGSRQPLDSAINRNERGAQSNPYTWTGTMPDGKVAGLTCSDWAPTLRDESGVIGNAFSRSSAWTQGVDPGSQLCSSQAALYCFQVQK